QAFDPEGHPFAGVDILPETVGRRLQPFTNLSGCDFPPFGVQTDARGVAVIDWLPANLQATASFAAQRDGYRAPGTVMFTAAEKRDEITLEARLVRLAPIRGRVTQPNGQPAPGVLVVAYGRGNHCARTAAD